jgi:hypothetical protein
MVGIDDFAWKGGHRHGTTIPDPERRRIIDILPESASCDGDGMAGRSSVD